MPYRIRRVDGSDDEIAADLKRLHNACFNDKTALPEFAEGYWWLCFYGKEPVGFAGMRASQRYKDVGYLSRSGVLPKHRGHGLQVRLLRAREKQAKRNGWSVIRTDTTQNPPSSNSLIKAGFRIFNPKYPWAFKDSIYWRKELI